MTRETWHAFQRAYEDLTDSHRYRDGDFVPAAERKPKPDFATWADSRPWLDASQSEAAAKAA